MASPTDPHVSRRQLLQLGAGAAARVAVGAPVFSLAYDLPGYGPLLPPDANGIQLPKGFSSRIVARQFEPVGDTGHVWHPAPDGGATFATQRGGWIYVSNSESSSAGGVGAIEFDPHANIIDAYTICSGTRRNCAGGATPWNTWLSCEEVTTGFVYECDPWGRAEAIKRPALGSFNHEAVAVDPRRRVLYLTEDQTDGGFYRFLPNVWPELSSGVLEVAEMDLEGNVTWAPIPVPVPDFSNGDLPTRRQVPTMARFRGGEGIVWDGETDEVFFVTKRDSRVWSYSAGDELIQVVYDGRLDPAGQLSGVDNITMTPKGNLMVAEDGGNMELVIVGRDGRAQAFLRVIGQNRSELAGPAFDPRGLRLYVSSQRGTNGRGITYEISGPFHPGNGFGFSRRRHRSFEGRQYP